MSPINGMINESSAGTANYPVSQIDLGKYDLKGAVKLPNREDPNEWIANNLFNFHKQICMLYGTVSEFCTPETCPKMTAGRKYEYWWSYGPERRPVEVSAPEYIDHLLDWVQEQLDDEDTFPSKSMDKEFPPSFRTICQTIARRLFRIYAHVYHHHLAVVRNFKADGHMNTSLKHFIYFVTEFDLVLPNDLEPLKDLVVNLA